MNSLPIGLVLASRATAQEALSARPDAPVVPHVDPVPAFRRTRKVVAGGLRHLADAVAPPLPVAYVSRRLDVCAGTE
ncbi:MAG TPA: hypothetical protein VF391_10415 [Dermatophilaceae bacterium]